MSIKTVSKGITRLELEDRKGYLVRISRNGNRVNKYFSDSVHGGKKKALALAKNTYQELLDQLGPAENATKGRLTNRNSTGVVGVHLAYSNDSRYPGCEYYAYCASWVTEEGKREKVSFAFNKYGEEQAFDLAVLARQQENNSRDAVVAMYERTAKGRKAKAKKTSKTSVKKSVKKQVKKTVKKAAKKAARKQAKKSTRPSVKKSVRKSAKTAAKKAAKRPAKKSVKKKAARSR
ncbi:AP2 domain-containing protein [Neorhodopirellula pilleata]|uniref:Uncharacterized protein n=1 Tax=Neorhodopirellula pilleata TaxID=2714738 RepID=A0A5C5ZKN8_9BACT|nr:AP2 domain-containing protein [Neorhodopirellula pilleata]TWT87972.1 hypothetical protein Pla100_58240 [Neorhodopirellula pilleata]